MDWMRHGHRLGAGLAVCWLALGAEAGAEGNVRVEVRPDGSKYIWNETPGQRARRLSSRLQVPRSEISSLIDFHARRQNLNPRLVQAVIQVESGYNPRARSRKGAMGLMQLTPETAKLLGVGDPYDPEQNIDGGTRYLRQQLDSFPNLSLALAAYNAGPTAVTQHDGIPPYRETRDYVHRVLALLGLAPHTQPSAAVRERAAAERHRREAAERQAAASPPATPKGRKVYLRRGENDRIFFTTVPPEKGR
jgi:hypothetical protein